MFSVIQTNFNGIDGLTYQNVERPRLSTNGVLVKMNVLPVTPTDWKRETNPQATNEQLAGLPRPIGIGGVGRVVAVGQQRDQHLMNQRVLVMQPQGSYSEYILSENPDWLFVLPADVTDQSAAALMAGPGTALVLKRQIEQSQAQNVVITGANSVIGLYLLQMLGKTKPQVWPVVSPASQSYFQQQLPDWQAVTISELPVDLQNTLVLDIAGSSQLLQEITDRLPVKKIVSIALMSFATTAEFQFVHEEFNADEYRQFIKDVSAGKFRAPIDRVFDVHDTKLAQHYAQKSHSRGRVLVTFDERLKG